MNFDVKAKVVNRLIGRTEFVMKASYEGSTPSNREVQSKLSKKENVDEKLVVIKHIYSGFGKQEAEIFAFIYDDLQTKEKFESGSRKEAAAAGEQNKPKEVKAEVSGG